MLDNELSVAKDAPDADDLADLAAQGISSVVNLRREGEPEETLPPDTERERCRELGLAYLHLPASPDDVTPDRLDHFRMRVAELPKPALVHCRSGKRAGAYALVDHAVREGLRPDEALERAEALGLDCSDGAWKQVIVRYIEECTGGGGRRRGAKPKPPERAPIAGEPTEGAGT